MKFDCVIQNPPYAGHLHLKFLKKGLNVIKQDCGKMTIIEPATWLINVRRNGKSAIYDEIKTLVRGHVKKVIIENYNFEFGTDTFVPFAITYIDMEHTYDQIEFICFGHRHFVQNIYDCNLIGEHKTITSILRKCQKYGDMMNMHITDKEIGKPDESNEQNDASGLFSFDAFDDAPIVTNVNGREYAYMPYNEIIGPCSYGSDFSYKKMPFGEFSYYYLSCCMHKTRNDINDKIVKKSNGNSDTAVYGTKEEIENWRHYITNNKLPLFLNICISFDQHNETKPYIPWLVDKQYTDEEIYTLLKLNKKEIALIDKTLKKFERYSPWYKRYNCGKDSATNEEVTKFVESL